MPSKQRIMNKRRAKGGKQSMRKPTGAGDLASGYKLAATSLSRISEGCMPLFPPRTHKMLRYHDNITLASTAGALSAYVFRANDCFDPNFTGTGHQPMGLDQMLVFYNHFCVDTCRITVNAANTGAGSMHAGVRLDASSSALSNVDQMTEFGGITYDVLEAKNTYGSSKTMTLTADIARLQGITRSAITADSTLRGDAATSPVEITYFHLVAWDPNGLSASINFDVIMEFGVWFLEPRDASLSIPSPSTLLGPKRKRPQGAATPVGAAPESKSTGWF